MTRWWTEGCVAQTSEFGDEYGRGRAYPRQELPGPTLSGQNTGRARLEYLGGDREGFKLGWRGCVRVGRPARLERARVASSTERLPMQICELGARAAGGAGGA